MKYDLDLERKKLNENSSLKELQEYVNKMVETRGFEDETAQDIMLLLTEEIGELAKEVRKTTEIKMDANQTRKTDVSGEIADILNYTLCMCKVMNIDLFEAFIEKEERNAKRTWK